MRCILSRVTATCVAAALLVSAAQAQALLGSQFTYQGRLLSNGVPVTGTVDVQFALMNNESAGSVVAGPLVANNVAVSGGVFTVPVDFGFAVFDGNARWLEIAVRMPAGSGGYTTLLPRQPLTAAPYALAMPGLSPDGQQNLGLQPGHYLAASPTDAFNYSGKTLGNYALGWFADPWSGTGATAWLSGYSGLKFFAGSQPRLAITETGLVGVGTTSPAAQFHVAGGTSNGVIRADSSSANAVLNLTTLGQIDWHVGVDRADGGKLKIGPAVGFGTEALVATSAGNIGLGTTNPQARLHIDGGTAGTSLSVSSAGTDPNSQYFAVVGGTNGPHSTGVYGVTNAATGQGVGVQGNSYSASGVGVAGSALAAIGNTIGVYGHAASPTGYAVYAIGRFAASGTKSFQIDHPLDPANRLLSHYCIEGPEPLNVYSGNVTTDAAGYATVQLPDYFEALNRDFRYQLTVIDEADSADFVAAKVVRGIRDNAFVVRTSQPNMAVSWRVEGVRNDRFVQAYGAPVEADKTAEQRGKYLQPELYGQPAEKGLFYGAVQRATPIGNEN